MIAKIRFWFFLWKKPYRRNTKSTYDFSIKTKPPRPICCNPRRFPCRINLIATGNIWNPFIFEILLRCCCPSIMHCLSKEIQPAR
ncbi:MAG: CRISPR-associated protein Cas5 [Desulfobacterales bacterium]|nr:MAG: CRISPR-associated protein Cas5 [Desulfobacterales bacterium]